MRTAIVGALLLLGAFGAARAHAVASLDLDVTITVDTGDEFCANTEVISVPEGTMVRVCYEIRNTGTDTLNQHDLVDDVLGTLLTDFPFTLMADASAFLTQTTTVNETTAFTGTWSATGPGPVNASDTDTAFAIVPEAATGATGAAAIGTLALLGRRRLAR